VLAAEIDVQVMGEAFASAYTHGDNSNVVATDTMKNFIHRESLEFDGATMEGWLFFLGRRFLETYAPMERLRVAGEEIRFDAAMVPAATADSSRARCSSIGAMTTGAWLRSRSPGRAMARSSSATCGPGASGSTS
jgi:urate oxidase